MRALLAVVFATAALAAAPAPTVNTCKDCHTALEGPLQKPALLIQTDVHIKAGLTCTDCHGGDNSVFDPGSSMDRTKGYIGKPARADIPKLCARCHSDAAYMGKHGQPKSDEYDLYKTSVHGSRLAKGDTGVAVCIDCHSVHDIQPVKTVPVANACGKCHVLFAQNFTKSVHGPLFAPPSGGGCTVCHSNHGIKEPSTAMLAGPNAVCAPCHDASTPGGQAAAQMAKTLDDLDASLKRSDDILDSAERYGMEVSEAQVRMIDGHESLVKATLAVHTFKPEEVKKAADTGMAIAAETLRTGQAALHEKDVRRFGLAVSAFLIAIAVAGIFMLIRRIEAR